MTAAQSSGQYFFAIGKRKTAVAHVRLVQDASDVKVNGQKPTQYFTGLQIENAIAPLVMTGTKGQYGVVAELVGGGKNAQSDALRHGITRALLLVHPEFRTELKRAGFLRRDSRTKERKKPGLHRARRAPQFSKR